MERGLNIKIDIFFSFLSSSLSLERCHDAHLILARNEESTDENRVSF